MDKQGKEGEERTRETVTEAAREFEDQKAMHNGVGRTVKEGRSMDGRFYTDESIVSTEEVASIDKPLTRELGVPVEASVAAEFEGRERPVILERSSYKRLPHSPVGTGIGDRG